MLLASVYHFFVVCSNNRGSKSDMQAAAGGAEYVGDEQGIMEGEQQYP